MRNDKHYPTHPGAEHPPTMTCEIPLEEYESLKREIERLNRELEHVKNGDCIYTCDVVEKHVKEELKDKRALWLARATIAYSTKYKYHRLSYKAEIDPQPHGWSCYINGEVYRTGKMNRKLEPHYWIELWEEVERKCRAKAEEYK